MILQLKSKLIICFLVVFVTTYSQEPIADIYPKSIEHNIKGIVDSGDINAYRDLYFALHKKGREKEYLVYSLFMANNYGYPDAFFWVYNLLFSLYVENNIQIDDKTLKIALEYLSKGVELGSKNAEVRMSELLLEGLYIPRDIDNGVQLHMKAWNVTDSISFERNLKFLKKKYNF